MIYGINVTYIVIGVVLLVAFYFLSIILNIRIVKGKYGFLPGTIKLYSVAIIVSVGCNLMDTILIKNSITGNFIWIKLILLVITLIWIYNKKNSGNPNYVADYKDINAAELDPDIPFSSTEGMALCIMIIYTFPIVVAMLFSVGITLLQGLFEAEKYEFKRAVIISIMACIESLIASYSVHLSYGLDLKMALFLVALIGLIFNMLLGTLNGIIVDCVTKKKYLKKDDKNGKSDE